MRRLIAVVITIILASIGLSGVAHADCDWRYDICKPSVPDIPKRHLGWPDPRPPLTDKNSNWCTKAHVTRSDGTDWQMITMEKIVKRAWPDYWHNQWAWVVEYNGAWVQPDTANQVSFWVDCDA